MRYWQFDVCNLISDFDKNKRRLASIQEAMALAKEYVEQMPEDSIKRDASFVINRENWQHKLNVELPRELEEKEYWQYGGRRQDGIVKSLGDIPYASIYNGRLKKGRTAKGKTAKEMFLHDLLTDYAIYLRKVASSVESLSKELSKLRI